MQHKVQAEHLEPDEESCGWEAEEEVLDDKIRGHFEAQKVCIRSICAILGGLFYMVVKQGPTSYEDAVRNSEKMLWKVAMKEKFDSFMQSGTWRTLMVGKRYGRGTRT